MDLPINQIIHGDCLEVMRELPEKSINLIVADPPYNIGKAKWDKIKNYIDWMGAVFLECQRVLKDNGSFYWFHNDMMQIAQLMEWIRLNTRFIYNSFIIWDKGNFRALSWKNPSENNNLRSWFNTCEYCLFYTFQGETGLTTAMLDTNNFPTLRKYFYDLLCYMGETNIGISKKLGHRKAEHCLYVMPKKTVIEKIGQKADHCFRYGSTQWDMPTPETYQQLIKVFGIDKWEGFREYEDLRREYEDLRYVHNLDKNHNNLWRSTDRQNNGQYHPTQKPTDIMKRIIKTSSNPDDIILDPFIGSGTTAIAALNTGRFFIGIEKEEKYVEIARKRIAEHTQQLSIV